MKKIGLLFGMIFTTSLFFGQDSIQDRECQRMLFFVKQELETQEINYANAAMYYLKGEKICGATYGAQEYIGMSLSLLSMTRDRFFCLCFCFP